jgi:branched-chain amino acid transport system substrate-binding protein
MRKVIALVALLGSAGIARSDELPTFKLGVLTDMTGVYADTGGPGSVAAAKMAVEDFRPEAKGFRVEVVVGDHQNKADIGSSIVRRWFDVEAVDAVADAPTSSVALAVSNIVRDKNKVLMVSSAGSSDLTGKNCTPNTIHWTYDTWALANSAAKAVTAEGGKSWYFITADYAFGHALERDATQAITNAGGGVAGHALAPFQTTDFSSFVLQAQGSGADVVAMATAGGDTINAVKQASEFGLMGSGQKVVALLGYITDIHAIGLETAQGLRLTEAFYWDMNAATRAFTERYRAANEGRIPTMNQAGVYSATLHWMKAIAAIGPTKAHDGAAVVAQMKALPTQDPLFGEGSVRADGRALHDLYVFEVKRPSESKAPYDYYKLLTTISGDQAFRPLKNGGCPLVSQ